MNLDALYEESRRRVLPTCPAIDEAFAQAERVINLALVAVERRQISSTSAADAVHLVLTVDLLGVVKDATAQLRRAHVQVLHDATLVEERK